MRRSWLRSVLFGILIGPAPVPMDPAMDPAETEPSELGIEQPAPRKQSGHSVQGPHFYVWDEDSREAADWAVELQRADG